MGGRKFRLAPHLKNEERLKKSALVVSIKRENISVHVSSVTITPSQLETTVDPQPLTCTVSVPLQVLSDGVVETLDRLAALLQLLNPFSSWTVADHGVLVISRLRFFFGLKAISYCLTIDQELQWSLCIQNRKINHDTCSLLSSFPPVVSSVSSLMSILGVLDNSTVCAGNPDADLVQQSRTMRMFCFFGQCLVQAGVRVLEVHCWTWLSACG